MAESKAFTIRTRKFMTNRLLSRKQFVSSNALALFLFKISFDVLNCDIVCEIFNLILYTK